MRPALALLALSMLSAAGVADEAVRLAGPVRPLSGTFVVGRCAREAGPDRALIVGAVTARSLKPTEARAQMERQVEAIRKYVQDRGGRLELAETVRAARALPPDASDGARPFVRVQRLEASFPAEAPVDEILEGLLQLGLDQYGREVRLDGLEGTPRVVVRYRVSALAEVMDEMQKACRRDAWRQWCGDEARAGWAECAARFEKEGGRLQTQTFTVRSQPLLAEHGATAPLEVHYPWQPALPENLELLGPVTLRLRGVLTAFVTDPAAEP